MIGGEAVVAALVRARAQRGTGDTTEGSEDTLSALSAPLAELRQCVTRKRLPSARQLVELITLVRDKRLRQQFIQEDGVVLLFGFIARLAHTTNRSKESHEQTLNAVQAAQLLMNEKSGLKQTVQLPNATFHLLLLLLGAETSRIDLSEKVLFILAALTALPVKYSAQLIFMQALDQYAATHMTSRFMPLFQFAQRVQEHFTKQRQTSTVAQLRIFYYLQLIIYNVTNPAFNFSLHTRCKYRAEAFEEGYRDFSR